MSKVSAKKLTKHNHKWPLMQGGAIRSLWNWGKAYIFHTIWKEQLLWYNSIIESHSLCWLIVEICCYQYVGHPLSKEIHKNSWENGSRHNKETILTHGVTVELVRNFFLHNWMKGKPWTGTYFILSLWSVQAGSFKIIIGIKLSSFPHFNDVTVKCLIFFSCHCTSFNILQSPVTKAFKIVLISSY